MIFYNAINIVESGNVGVVVRLGKAQPNALEEGVHLVVPFITVVKSLDIKIKKAEVKTAEVMEKAKAKAEAEALNLKKQYATPELIWLSAVEKWDGHIYLLLRRFRYSYRVHPTQSSTLSPTLNLPQTQKSKKFFLTPPDCLIAVIIYYMCQRCFGRIAQFG
ncbi:MAG: hypothetical protein LBC02_07320 [Planctomycetaceae bacterium]|nr:hypothetical protein [Planctomycetaceae bacterium]